MCGVLVVNPDKWHHPYLPELPKNLKFLDARSLQLETLPPLPPNLVLLLLSGNKKLKSLPPLPSSLEELLIDDTGITELPTLPRSLLRLECQNTQITALPTLPPNLSVLMCHNTALTMLPSLPDSLRTLNCGSCQLRSLPRLSELVNVCCVPNPWNSNFVGIFPTVMDTLDYPNATQTQKRFVNWRNDVQEINKAKARFVVNIHLTLARAEFLPDDICNLIGSFGTGNNTTLVDQIGRLRKYV